MTISSASSVSFLKSTRLFVKLDIVLGTSPPNEEETPMQCSTIYLDAVQELAVPLLSRRANPHSI